MPSMRILVAAVLCSAILCVQTAWAATPVCAGHFGCNSSEAFAILDDGSVFGASTAVQEPTWSYRGNALSVNEDPGARIVAALVGDLECDHVVALSSTGRVHRSGASSLTTWGSSSSVFELTGRPAELVVGGGGDSRLHAYLVTESGGVFEVLLSTGQATFLGQVPGLATATVGTSWGDIKRRFR